MTQENSESKGSTLFLFLCALLPVTSFLSYNRLEIQMNFSRGILYTLVIFALLILTFEGLKRVFKSLNKAALAVSLGLLCVVGFHFSVIHNGLSSLIGESYRFRHFVILAPVLCLSVLIASYFLAKSKTIKLKQFLVAAMVVFIGMDAYQIMITPKSQSASAQALTTQSAQAGPNVYYILPDAMMGPEAYQKTYHTEHKLAQSLKDNGFLVNKNAYTNAPFTIYSLAHLFNMNYLLDIDEIVTPEKSHHLAQIAKGNNPVFNHFKESGHKIIHVVDGYVSTCSGFEDTCIEKNSFLTQQDVSFIDRTQIISLLNNLQFLTQTFNLTKLHYPKAMEMEELISMLPIKSNDNYFMMIHLGLPHLPYRYHADCSTYNGDVAYFSGDKAHKAHIYQEQHQCAEKKLQLLVNKISEDDPNALIVVQSDHGPLIQDQGFKSNHDLTAEALMQNFNIISAYKLPESCQKMMPEEPLSPVNTFRLIFACLDNKQPDFLPHKSYVVYPLNNPAGHEPTLAFNPTMNKG